MSIGHSTLTGSIAQTRIHCYYIVMKFLVILLGIFAAQALASKQRICNVQVCDLLRRCLNFNTCHVYYYTICRCEEESDTQCGVADAVPAPRISTYIVGGNDARECELPWTVVIFRDRKFRCGGAIIDENHVITAAHCLNRMSDKEELLVGYGSIDRRRTNNATVVSHISHHLNVADVNDIAILRLRDPVEFGKCVKPICLPPSTHLYKTHHTCIVAGWGLIVEASLFQPNFLQKVKVPLLSWNTCHSSYNNMVDTQLCAGYLEEGGKDACQTDSGGPLICEYDGRWTLIGIVSSGLGCARPGFPGIYTQVSKYIPWINYIIKSTKPTLF